MDTVSIVVKSRNLCLTTMKGRYLILVCIVTLYFILIAIHFASNYHISYDRGIFRKYECKSSIRDCSTTTTSTGSRGQMRDYTCQNYYGQVPNIIIQYGPRRTASTLQYQILCLMMAMLHEDDVTSVGCYFHTNHFSNVTVLKTHNMRTLTEAMPKHKTKHAWVFMTSEAQPSKEFNFMKRITEKNKLTIRYIMNSEMVSKRGYLVAYEYQSIFGISDTKMSRIITYLRYWEILRRCCGKQMSSDWRNQLTPEVNYRQHYHSEDAGYPACEMYNITSVEVLFINTYVYKQFTPIVSLNDTIGKPSDVDGTLNGHYCETCNKNITRYGLNKINDKCV